MFSAIVIDKNDDGQTVSLQQLGEGQLPEGDVTIDVAYSTLNFKDGLAITGSSPVVRKFPMVPGIDLVGTVSESSHADWKAGDTVVLNGWGVGEGHWGGLAQKARLKGDWLVPLPAAFTPQQAMAIGTAGYTAALCVDALVNFGVTPDKGEVLVTGATGGVGSVAVALLAKAGFTVAAAAGRGDNHRPCRFVGKGQADAARALGRRNRFGGQFYFGQRYRPDQVLRRSCCMRSGARAGLADERDAIHPARCQPAWRGQCDGAQGSAFGRMGASGARS